MKKFNAYHSFQLWAAKFPKWPEATLFKKETLAQVFYYEFHQIFQNIFRKFFQNTFGGCFYVYIKDGTKSLYVLLLLLYDTYHFHLLYFLDPNISWCVLKFLLWRKV